DLSRSLREEEEEHPPLATAVPALDRLLDGGLPRGHLVEMVGGRSSGRFSALLAALAATTSVGEAAALVDLGDGLDPGTAETLGADLARLLWVRPTTLQEAVAAAEMLLGAGFPLVAVDLGNPPVRGGRGVEAVWLRLARAARHHRGALLVSSPYRATGTAAAEVLSMSRRRGIWLGSGAAPRLLAGVDSRLEREKSRRQPGAATGSLQLRAPGVVTKEGPPPEIAPAKPSRRRAAKAPDATTKPDATKSDATKSGTSAPSAPPPPPARPPALA
ncbi:MAG: hypothetical protein ABUL63_00095, partial [Acidobacteriota bacterium]